VNLKIVATRRVGARLQHAKLYEGRPDDGDIDLMYFSLDYIRVARGSPSVPSTAFRWLAGVTEMDALVDVRWTRGNWAGYAERQNAPSTLRAQFRWSGPDDHVDMSLTDACMTLEHWVDWRG
jgi:hypothetical protein